TMWFIFALIATIQYCKGNFYDEMSCANCSRVNEKCEITTTGWSCDYDFDANLLIDNSNKSSDIPESLSKCMLPSMEFKKKKAINGYCCIWSPKIGCQKLKKSDEDEDLCYRCTRAIWSSAMEGTTCPCGNWFMHRENSEIMLKPWNILFITQGMLIIIIN
ncbi:hypothetical protein KR059_002669, partial [Drosophila kikkawai]